MKALQSLKLFFGRRYRYPLSIMGLLLLCLFLKFVYSSYYHPTSDEDFFNSYYSSYKFSGITIPKDLNFCGEKIPTENKKVRRSLEKELADIAMNQPSTLILNKKAARWFPVIEPILKRNGVPDDFKYFAVIESGLTNSTSQPKAGGFWQLMPPVAQHYGLEMSDQVDERFNIEKSTDAACKCILDAYKKYGNWTLAAASYNMGTGALDRQMGKQKAGSYYLLNLNPETSRYIFRLLAFKEIISRPEAYGYKIRPRDLYAPIPTYAVKVDSSITDLNAFAVSQGSTYTALKLLNPWLLKSSLNNPAHKKYTILFPRKGVKLYGMDETNAAVVVTDPSKDTLKPPVPADTMKK